MSQGEIYIFPHKEEEIFFFQILHNCSGAQPATCLMENVGFFPGLALAEWKVRPLD